MSVHLTLDSDPVQYLCAIDARKQGVEVYQPGTLKHALVSCCGSRWSYTFPDSNVFFKKKSLNDFLSENLGKLIDVNSLSYEEIVEKISKIAKKASKKPDNFTERQVSFVVKTVKQPNPKENEILVQLDDYTKEKPGFETTPFLPQENSDNEGTEGEQLTRNRFETVEPSPLEIFSKHIDVSPEDNSQKDASTEHSKDLFVGIPYQESDLCPDFSLKTPPPSPEKEPQEKKILLEEQTQNNSFVDDTQEPTFSKQLNFSENPSNNTSERPLQEFLIGVPLHEQDPVLFPNLSVEVPLSGSQNQQEKKELEIVEEPVQNNISIETKEDLSDSELDLNKLPRSTTNSSLIEISIETPEEKSPETESSTKVPLYGESTPLFGDLSVETPPTSPQKALPEEKVKVKREPVQRKGSTNKKVEVKKEAVKKEEVKGALLTGEFEKINELPTTRLPLERLRVFNRTHSALINRLLDSEVADRQEASRVFLAKIMGMDKTISSKSWKRTTDNLLTAFEMQCDLRSGRDSSLLELFTKIIKLTK